MSARPRRQKDEYFIHTQDLEYVIQSSHRDRALFHTHTIVIVAVRTRLFGHYTRIMCNGESGLDDI